ncbi:MAG: beta-ketoacyl synthase [Lentisphaeria bacterium]|nr:beta-ketoacyl synthase [Lentisphaeria bacterium]
MRELSAFVQGRGLATPFGTSLETNCAALFDRRNSFRLPVHFDSKGRLLGIDPELDCGSGSRAVRLLVKLRETLPFTVPAGSMLFLATTVGAIDLLETGKVCDTSACLLEEAKKIFGISEGMLVSAACASGQTAGALALEQLKAGNCRHALVIGCDIASEFVTAGFAALGACSKTICRPYDAERDGLTLGEAAAALLLGRSGDGEGRIIRAAENCDAAHITAPDLTGKILRQVIDQALSGDMPGGIIGHGTGTVYNDQAETAALHRLFPENPPPLYSLKGNYGHTLGATGVLQLVLGLEFSRRKELPPQAGLRKAMPTAAVKTETQKLSSSLLLSLNVGFGGLNSAVALEAL